MTGFGEARHQEDSLAIGVEVRTINSRYFKLAFRSSDGYSALEPLVENVVRKHIKRGTVQVNLRIDHAARPDDFRVNSTVLAGYRKQLEELRRQWQISEPLALDSLLLLPGVVDQGSARSADLEQDWPLVAHTLEAAMQNMSHMRREEGRVMSADLTSNCAAIAQELAGIERRAPQVAESFRARLLDRLSKTLAEYQVTLNAADLVREMSIFAERSDVSEEVVRLRSHLDQFAAIMADAESSGRKLEFLTQEMFREANTIGSKANDVQIARHVIEIKAAIERVREMIQNVE